MKKCKMCLEEKLFDEFYKTTGGKYYRPICKACTKIKGKEYNDKTKDIRKLKAQKYYKKNKSKINAYNNKYAQNHKSERKNYYVQYNKDNKAKIREWRLAWRKDNILFKIQNNLRRRIIEVMARVNTTKHTKTINLLGCTYKEFKLYIESKFVTGMTWNNYGLHGWHIDHVIPCAAFDLTKPEQQYKCFHYTNLQPLWARDNWSKADSLPNNTKEDQK